MEADIVLPSLDAATTPAFMKVNRPHPHLRLETIVEGMKTFRREYRGQLWLEILFVKGLNDSDEEISSLKHIIDEINPDKIQLNTVVRPPVETNARPVSRAALERICTFLGPKCEVIGSAEGEEPLPFVHPDADRVVALLSRRAMTLAELSSSLGSPDTAVQRLLDELAVQEMIQSFEFDGKHFFEATKIPA
jgi:wyosine [tRNA(Phe)-imidazoG37] synthetase (radical SAM superfamily)